MKFYFSFAIVNTTYVPVFENKPNVVYLRVLSFLSVWQDIRSATNSVSFLPTLHYVWVFYTQLSA